MTSPEFPIRPNAQTTKWQYESLARQPDLGWLQVSLPRWSVEHWDAEEKAQEIAGECYG